MFAYSGAGAAWSRDAEGDAADVGNCSAAVFSVVGDFAKGLIGIKDTAAKDLKKTLDDPDGKKAKAEADAKKKAMSHQ